jgi:LuxR family maltose regulon positive regulatory protein
MLYITRITKPKVPSALVERPRLYRQLDRWQEMRTIIIHAPVGYGKSSLVSRWIDRSNLGEQAAWFSLDESDADPLQFVRYCVAALDRIIPGVLQLIQPILEDSQGSAQRALTRLLSAIDDELAPAERAGQDLLLVLDDLHRVQSPEVDALLLTVLEKGPAWFHLLLLARQRTELPLARLLAREQVVVLNTEDMRFTTEEVYEYLLQQGFSPPSEPEVAQLVARSEGWVTALQLAALSLRWHNSVADLLGALQGDRGWLAEYLIDEVLNRQTPELRRFLLQTSILDEFNASLCTAVTGDAESFARLAALVQADLFLIRLGSDEGWFRYHHLFQELLQHRLRTQTDPVAYADLHRRAAVWLVDAGQIRAAVHHLLAAGDADRAAALVETQVHDVVLQDPHRAQRYLNLLPQTLREQRPRIMLDRCRLAMLLEDSGIGEYVRQAESTIVALPPTSPQFPAFCAELHVCRASAFYYQYLIEASAEAAAQAQTYVHHMDDFTFGTLCFVQMHHHSLKGAYAEAWECAEAALAVYQRAGFAAGVVALQRELAIKVMRRGHARTASDRFRALIGNPIQEGAPVLRELAWTYFSAAENSYWQNLLEQAHTYQASLMAVAKQLQDEHLIALANVVAETYAAAETPKAPVLDEPTAYLSELAANDLRSFLFNLRVRCLIAAGRSEQAWQIACALGLSAEIVTPAYPGRMLIPFCLAYIGHGVDLPVLTPLLLAALARRAEAGNRFEQLHLLALMAWQQLRMRDAEAAAPLLVQAVQIAQETGYVRVLLDLPELAELLSRIEDSSASALSVKGKELVNRTDAVLLTAQERNVLKLLAADRTYQQIAEELVMSINTVRTHVRHVYRKLSVRRRDQAIDAAHRRGLLATRGGLAHNFPGMPAVLLGA